MSSYLYFAQEKREGVMKKNPNAPPAEISKILGEMWKETKNTKKYDKLAADAKKVYDEQKAVYDDMMKARKEAKEQEKIEKLQHEKEEALKMYKTATRHSFSWSASCRSGRRSLEPASPELNLCSHICQISSTPSSTDLPVLETQNQIHIVNVLVD